MLCTLKSTVTFITPCPFTGSDHIQEEISWIIVLFTTKSCAYMIKLVNNNYLITCKREKAVFRRQKDIVQFINLPAPWKYSSALLAWPW